MSIKRAIGIFLAWNIFPGIAIFCSTIGHEKPYPNIFPSHPIPSAYIEGCISNIVIMALTGFISLVMYLITDKK